MKRLKRVLAVILLSITVLAVGYLFFTGSRLTAVYENNIESGVVYEKKQTDF